MRALVAISVLAMMSGCGFDSAGTASDDARADPIDSAIAPGDAHEDTAPIDTGPTCDLTACGPLPMPTVKRVALVDRGVACPAGFVGTDVVEQKDGAGCTCNCTLTPPTCPGTGSIPTFYGDGSCGSTGLTLYSVNSGVCSTVSTDGGTLKGNFRATAPGPIGGGCAGSVKTDAAAVTVPRRVCEPNPGTCAAPICEGTAYLECIEVSGACPAPFVNSRTIGTSANVSGCPSCDCAMSTVTCSGKIALYGSSCSGTPVTLAVDGTCVAVPTGSGTIFTFKYTPNPAPAATCNASYTTKPGTTTLTGERKLCCK